MPALQNLLSAILAPVTNRDLCSRRITAQLARCFPLSSAALVFLGIIGFGPSSIAADHGGMTGLLAYNDDQKRNSPATRNVQGYGFCREENGHRAWNPAQQWHIHFDGHGFTARPEEGGWSWGLELRRYGFEGYEVPLESRAESKIDGPRLSYLWSPELEEWFVNDARGLEHGFTVTKRPLSGNSASPLIFDIAIRGSLRPQVIENTGDVSFADLNGNTILTYEGLKVWDADGRRLSAAFTAVGQSLRLNVCEAGARYPLTIDPIAQEAYLKPPAPHPQPSDFGSWGESVAIDGDTAVIGSWRNYAGSADVFVRKGTTWFHQATLEASNADAYDGYGFDVAVHGDTMVIGAPREDSRATGINGNPLDNSAEDSGAAYVYVRDGNTWIQQAYLKASMASHGFGRQVALWRDTLVIAGSPRVFVFVRTQSTWTQQAILTPPNTMEFDDFGQTVAISKDTIAVGRTQENDRSGAVYLFVRDEISWPLQARIQASNAAQGDGFGLKLDLTEHTLVVGVPWEDSGGAAYVFVRKGSMAGPSWTQQAYLKASNMGEGDGFGGSVAISGDVLVVGAGDEDSSDRGLGRAGTDNNAENSGAAYVYARSGSSWRQVAFMKASNADTSDNFGADLALSAQTLIVTAPGESSSATGVNGNQSDNDSSRSGAGYVFGGFELPITPLDSWRQSHFGTAANEGIASDFADPDNDGLVNLMEFATGEDPTASSVQPLKKQIINSNINWIYRRDLNADHQMDFYVEWSTTLEGLWSREGISEEVLSEVDSVQTVRVKPWAVMPSAFLRLRVER